MAEAIPLNCNQFMSRLLAAVNHQPRTAESDGNMPITIMAIPSLVFFDPSRFSLNQPAYIRPQFRCVSSLKAPTPSGSSVASAILHRDDPACPKGPPSACRGPDRVATSAEAPPRIPVRPAGLVCPRRLTVFAPAMESRPAGDYNQGVGSAACRPDSKPNLRTETKSGRAKDTAMKTIDRRVASKFCFQTNR